MFRFVVICGCLMAVAQAGLIGGGIITGLPSVAALQQPTLALRPAGTISSVVGNAGLVALPAISAASSSSNIIRGIGPVATATTVLGGRGNGLIGGGASGLAINGYGLGGLGGPAIGIW